MITKESIEKVFAERANREMEHIDKLSEELEVVKKQAAAMRQAIGDFVHNVKHNHVAGMGDFRDTVECDASFRELEPSLSSNAGHDYISRESVKPLVDALVRAHQEVMDGVVDWLDLEECIDNAVIHARTLGLIPKFESNENPSQVP